MTVGELKHILQKLDNDTIVLFPSDDHSFRDADAGIADVLKYPTGDYCEYYETIPLFRTVSRLSSLW